jgi:hypothetical protein
MTPASLIIHYPISVVPPLALSALSDLPFPYIFPLFAHMYFAPISHSSVHDYWYTGQTKHVQCNRTIHLTVVP